VLTAGVVSITSGKAVVMLFANQSVTNTVQKGLTTDNSRIVVTLEQIGERWLLQDLKLL
jgi:Mce-associated membrane protein